MSEKPEINEKLQQAGSHSGDMAGGDAPAQHSNDAERMTDMTIVTSRRLVIDPETGEVRFEEIGEPDSSQPEAAAAPLPSEIPMSPTASAKIEAIGMVEQAAKVAAESGNEIDITSTISKMSAEQVDALAELLGNQASPAVDEPVESVKPEAKSTLEAPAKTEESSNTKAPPKESATAAKIPEKEKSPGPKAGGLVVEKKEAEAPQASSPPQPAVSGSSGTNQRLSAETLFAFALPEAVLSEAVSKAKEVKASRENEKNDRGRNSPSAKNPKGRLGVLIGGGLAALVFVAFLVISKSGLEFNSVSDLATAGDPKTPTQSKALNSNKGSNSQAKSNLDALAANITAEKSTSDSAKDPLKFLNEDITPKRAQSLSIEQLVTLTGSSNVMTLSSVIKEAGRRLNPELLVAVSKLSNHPEYLVRVGVMKIFSNPKAYSSKTRDLVQKQLLPRLDDKDELVRGFTARALAASGDKTLLANLRARLDNEESDIVIRMIRLAVDSLENS